MACFYLITKVSTFMSAKFEDKYTASQLSTLNPVFAAGTIVRTKDTGVFIIHDGILEHNSLPVLATVAALTAAVAALAGTAATGSYTLAAKPAVNDTLVFNGVTFTFVA